MNARSSITRGSDEMSEWMQLIEVGGKNAAISLLTDRSNIPCLHLHGFWNRRLCTNVARIVVAIANKGRRGCRDDSRRGLAEQEGRAFCARCVARRYLRFVGRRQGGNRQVDRCSQDRRYLAIASALGEQ